jgi:hypothetical protein
MSVEERSAELLAELGWEVDPDLAGPGATALRRVASRFRTAKIIDDEREWVLISRSSVRSTGSRVLQEPTAAVLARRGWASDGPKPGWAPEVLAVEAADWSSILDRVRARRTELDEGRVDQGEVTWPQRVDDRPLADG